MKNPLPAVAILVAPNDQLSLDEQLQEVVGPFASAAIAHEWIRNSTAPLDEGEFWTVLELRDHSISGISDVMRGQADNGAITATEKRNRR